MTVTRSQRHNDAPLQAASRPAGSAGVPVLPAVVVGIFACLPIAIAHAQPPLQARLEQMVAKHENASLGIVGISAVDVATGEPLASIRSDRLFCPASNAKLLTSAFSLERLGKDFHFMTMLCAVGDDLVVIGDGDPTLGDPVLARSEGKTIYAELDRWAEQVRNGLGPRVPGNLLVCGLRNVARYRHEDWPDKQHRRWYAAPVAGLNFNDNCLDITFRIQGARVEPIVEPGSRLMRIVSDVKPGKRHIWNLTFAEGDSLVKLTGTAQRSAAEPISVAVNDPPMLLGRVLADRLARAGVTIAGKVRTVAPGKVDWSHARLIARTRTPLRKALGRSNKRSLNLAAECLLLRAGDGTWPGSVKLATATLTETFGLAAGSFRMRDGSGLSSENRVSPAAMTRLLCRMLTRPAPEQFVSSLPISGTDGTLTRRLNDALCRRRIRAKTGYISGVSALSGYVCDKAGRPRIAFSVLVNRIPAGKGFKAKQLQDAVCRSLAQRLDP